MADSMKRGLYDDLLIITCGSHAMISDFLARLAAGSPEVIEAMARHLPVTSSERLYAALAAGMKVIAND